MAMPLSRNSPKVQKKKQPAKKQWKAVPLKPSAISATKPKKKNPAPIGQTLALLKRYYPDAHCALNFETPFQLLIATIVSAQCTDERVNKVTPELFENYPSAVEMAKASVDHIEELIRTTGFFKNKAKNILQTAKVLCEKHQAAVPKDLEALIELAGVGRKTANVVLGNAYNITSGIVVDTHVTRLSNRLGWVKTENALIIERDLQKIIPHKDWILISHLLISHGRAVCKARTPQCATCFLFEECPKIVI